MMHDPVTAPPLKPSSFRPISSFIIKIASRCNLNCTYCYMYNLADKSYMLQPAVMSREVVEATVSRIQQHAQRQGLDTVSIIFHGGEPLLAGEAFFRSFVETANARLAPAITPRFSMQTNATLLTAQWLELLAELQVSFGISLDGPQEVNDANRVDHQGRGSYARVAQAIRLVTSNRRCADMTKSALTVINVESDPLVVYRHLRELGFDSVDFLLPDGTYDAPPPGVDPETEETPYADWLIPIFDEWFSAGDDKFLIRLFTNILRMIFGAERSTENIGGRKGACVVIETDGGIEPVSSLKACGDGFTKVGLNVVDHEIDEIYQLPSFHPYLSGPDMLCDQCKRCPIVDVCGGGYLPHRYRSTNGFDNPSIYCKDLIKLISHIQDRALHALPDTMRSELHLATLADLLDETQQPAAAKALNVAAGSADLT